MSVENRRPEASRRAGKEAARLLRFTLGLVLTGALPLAARKPKADDGPAAQLSEAPPSARSLQNPLVGQYQAEAAGFKLYQQHCAQCHGPDGYGMDRAANLHAPTIQQAPPGVLFWAIRNGRLRKGMPSWSRLPDPQIWQLVTYLKRFR